MAQLLEGKVAIVTGGTRGIGRAIVKEFAYNGARVIFTYLNSESVAREVVAETKVYRTDVEAIKADARNYSDARKVVDDSLKKFGKIDILINNAGITKDKALMMMSPAEWQEVIDTNLTGYFNMAKACIVTMMKQKSGNIINVSSVAGVVGLPRQVNYSSSKAGIIGLTKSVAKELASRNICVNAIAPGFIRTDMTSKLPEEVQKKMLSIIPLARFGEAKDVADLALFLSSESSSYITGQVIQVDGGMVM